MYATRDILSNFRDETTLSIRKKYCRTRHELRKAARKAFGTIGEYVEGTNKNVVRIHKANK
jgi:hypothetical protein